MQKKVEVDVCDSGSTPGIHIAGQHVFCVSLVQPKAKKKIVLNRRLGLVEVPSQVSVDTGGHGLKGPILYLRQAYLNKPKFRVQLLVQLILCLACFWFTDCVLLRRHDEETWRGKYSTLRNEYNYSQQHGVRFSILKSGPLRLVSHLQARDWLEVEG
jgi:hypothetical protein